MGESGSGTLTRHASRLRAQVAGCPFGLESLAMTDRSKIARDHLVPMICVIAASLALGLAPFLYGKLQTGDWSAPNNGDLEYYLQIAAQPYYEQVPYLSDPAVPHGAIFYPWLQFVPAVYVARAFGLGVFSISLVWMVFAAVTMAATLYGLFWYFLRGRWLAAGLTIGFLADSSDYHPLIHQIATLLGGLLHFRQDWRLTLFHFRLVNPALDLPFLFLQILAVAAARNRPSRVRIWISGAFFGVLFYVYFYTWTMAAGALGLAFVIDSESRGLYARTFAIGFILGIPAIVHDLLVRRALSAEGLARFGLFVAPKDFESVLAGHDIILVPALCAALIVGIVLTGNHQMIYSWCLAAVGFGLSYSSKVTGIYLHDYHWGWLARPVFWFVLCATVASVVVGKARLSVAWGWAWGSFVVMFFMTGLYASTLDVRRMPSELRTYSQYRTQRLAEAAAVLRPRALIGGDNDFCELSVIGEDLRALAGWEAYSSMAMKNSDLYARYALNEYLSGIVERGQFKKAASQYAFEGDERLIDGFVSAFDEVSHEPQTFLDAYDVRYVALRVDQPPPDYLKDGWQIIQDGPYWRIWQRTAHPVGQRNDGAGA